MYQQIFHSKRHAISRRRFLGGTAKAALAAGMGATLQACAFPLDPETSTLVRVLEGLQPRLVARSGYPSAVASDYRWHNSPDGGACFDAGDGGWIYLSNCESREGGVGALRFDANGSVIDSYSVLTGSRVNCSGGPTPWGSWLSCEEVGGGVVWECDPFGRSEARVCQGLGRFKHESACVDPLSQQIYMTEDSRDGCLYRYTPANAMSGERPDLDNGKLEVATIASGKVYWIEIADPTGSSKLLRYQVADATRFRGGEGIDLREQYVRFTTKRDNVIWQLDLLQETLTALYRLDSLVHNLDDLTHTPNGNLLVAEDGVGMRVLHLGPGSGLLQTLVQLPQHHESEITGLAFDPQGTRLYFSSQRGNTGNGWNGLSFELFGNFDDLRADAKLVSWRLDHREIAI